MNPYLHLLEETEESIILEEVIICLSQLQQSAIKVVSTQDPSPEADHLNLCIEDSMKLFSVLKLYYGGNND